MEEAGIKILFSVALTTYSIIFGIIAKKVWDVPKTVRDTLKDFETKLTAEIGLAHRRLDATDRIVSKSIRAEYDSKAVVESGVYPEKIRSRKENN
jgi:Flp pilus assembly protein CpaB